MKQPHQPKKAFIEQTKTRIFRILNGQKEYSEKRRKIKKEDNGEQTEHELQTSIII